MKRFYVFLKALNTFSSEEEWAGAEFRARLRSAIVHCYPELSELPSDRGDGESRLDEALRYYGGLADTICDYENAGES